MGQINVKIQSIDIIQANKQLFRHDIVRIKEMHDGFKMLCETFTMSINDMKQICAFQDTESVFNNLDSTGNGLIDAIELFTLLAIYSDSRLEDRLRFIFDLYDFNEKGVLEEVDLHFMIYTSLQGIVKVHNILSEAVENQPSAGNTVYYQLLQLMKQNFEKNFKINCNMFIMWQQEANMLKEFFEIV